MSNFSCAVRTNYFRVKDEAKFRASGKPEGVQKVPARPSEP